MCSNCNEKEKYYITTAIAYTSGKPHIVTPMNLCLRMRSQDIKEARAMMSISRPEQTSMARRLS